MDYKEKYLLYKKKYLLLKNQGGGVSIDPREVMTKNSELVRTINYSVSDNGETITLDTEIILNNGKIIKGLCKIIIFENGDLYMTDLYVNNIIHSDKTLTNCGIGTWMLNIIIKYYISKFEPEGQLLLRLISSPEAITYYKKLGFEEDDGPRQMELCIDVISLGAKLDQIMLKRKQAQERQREQEIIIEPQTFTLDQEKEKCQQYTIDKDCVSNGCWYDKGICKPTYLSVVKLGK
jgi:hypothetical protein